MANTTEFGSNVFELHPTDVNRDLPTLTEEEANVLPFTTPSSLAEEPILAVLEAEWRSLFQGTAIPRRANVTADLLGRALPHAFIAEQIAPGHARLRVAGRKVSDLLGCEAKGMPLSCLIASSNRSQFQENLRSVFENPALVEIPVESKRAIGRPALVGQMLLMPLADHNGDVNMLLGGIVLDGALGIRPRRMQFADCLPIRQEQIRPQFDVRPALKLVVDNA